MATIKSYTDIEQSRKLIELGIDARTADMHYSWIGTTYLLHAESYNEIIAWRKEYAKTHKHPSCRTSIIPCWSLAALLDVIPQEIFDGEYIINVTEGCANRWVLTYDNYENRNHSYYGLSSCADTLVDACYEMILKLNELKML